MKRAVRVTRGGAVMLRDQDVAGMEDEMEMLVGVRGQVCESPEWQLEVGY